MKIDVMIPAFDEFENLAELIPRVRASLADETYEFVRIHVIHRHDESTYEIQKLETLDVDLIRRYPSNSFGDAIRSGINALPTDSQLTVFLDADGSHDPNTIPRLVEVMKNPKVDVGIASRYTDGGSSDNGLVLKSMSRILNAVYGIVLGISARDISTNFKIYRSDQIKQVKLSCQKFDILEELLIRLEQNSISKLNIHEIPDHFHNRVHGESKRKLGPFIAGYIITLFRLRFKSQ
jgi:dolichol-phosphate mannosyltransferase